jgi:DNA-damage-inducible protein J
MATKTTNINLRIDPVLKAQAERLFEELGLTTATACNIFLKQAVRQGKIPFEISSYTPNDTTLAALREAESISKDLNVKGYQSAADMLKDLGL